MYYCYIICFWSCGPNADDTQRFSPLVFQSTLNSSIVTLVFTLENNAMHSVVYAVVRSSSVCHLLLFLCLSTPAGAQAADDTPPLRQILCLALRFAPAQFHASQLLLNCPLPCVLWSSSVSTTLRGPSQSLFRYTATSFPYFVPNSGPIPTSNRCLHGILLSHVPQFFIGYLVFPVNVENSS